MSSIFIVAAGRTLGSGIHAHGPGSRIPVRDATTTDPETGAVTAFSLSEARSHVATGFGRFADAEATPAPAATSGLVTGTERRPAVLGENA